METATQTLHRLTSYEPGQEWDEPIDDPRVVQDLESNDLARFPWFFKRYVQPLPRLPLPRSLPSTTAPAVGVLAGTADVAHTEPDLPQLCRLLHLSAGVVRTMVRPPFPTWLFRAAGSAGGRFPLELYVAVPDGTTLPAGVHWYDPLDHALVQVGRPPNGDAPVIVVTGVPWRTGWRYRERGYRHVYWDAGTMLAQLLVVADSAGISTRLFTRFPDKGVTALVGAEGVHEWPVAVVALGDGAPALEASGPAVAGDVDARPSNSHSTRRRSGRGTATRLRGPWTEAPRSTCRCGSRSVETVVLARGSQRRMDATRGVPEDTLRTSMLAALRGIDLSHFVVVHDVGELAPGVYRGRCLRTGAARRDAR